MKKILLFLSLLLTPATLLGQAQGSFFSGTVQTQQGLRAGATITVCSTAVIANSPTGATESGNTVTITTNSPHGFVAGQVVQITGVLNTLYNGSFTVLTVPTNTTFTYTNANSGLGASGQGAVLPTNVPCTPTASIYSDIGLTAALSNPITSSGLGNFSFYAAPGLYVYSITGQGILASSGGPFTFQLPCIAGQSCVSTSTPNTFSVLQTFNAGINSSGPNTLNGQSIIAGYNFSGLRFGENNKFPTVASIQSDCGSNPCPFVLTPLFTSTTLFSPLRTQDFLLDLRQIPGGYGPSLIISDIPPAPGNSAGYPAKPGSQDSGINLQYLIQGSYKNFNLTGTTFGTNYSPFYNLHILSGNPTIGAGNRQWVGWYNALETSSANDLANVLDIKLGNYYLGVRATGFTGLLEGVEFDTLYRAAGTISAINYATFNDCGIQDAIAANVTGTSFCSTTLIDMKGSGAVGNFIANDVRLNLQMAGGTQAGFVGYCFSCISNLTAGGTVTAPIVGTQWVGPSTLPTFSAGSYWFASRNRSTGVTGANVNNNWWDGGDWNSGHLTFGGDGGATASHVWWSPASGLRWKAGSAPTSSSDGVALLNMGSVSGAAAVQMKRGIAGCATAASIGAVCSTTVTWTTTFNDTNYTVTGCTGNGVTSGAPLIQGITAKASASITVQTIALTAAAAQFTNIECGAVHD